MIDVQVSQQLKAKCAKAALGCVEAEVATGATSAALHELLRSCGEWRGIHSPLIAINDPVQRDPGLLALATFGEAGVTRWA